jgi:serine/threonine-protein kinase
MPSSAANAPDADFLALQSALAGQFSLERELGRGGMGIVYLAREVQLERPVAIKVLPPALGAREELRDRFMREARTAAQLSHPNIVPIFRVDQVAEFVFIVMAFIDGETLTQRVRTRGPLPAPRATRLIQEIAWALAYAHARGVVHRDIKPDNILIEQGSGRALVTDFGIARVQTATALTEVGQVMGTAHFMSPEQASGEAIDGRSDLYSLGVVAHFALTGKFPFDGPTVQAILAKHLTQAAPSLAVVGSAVPRALAQAVDRCLAKDPAARYESGEALAEAVAATAAADTALPLPLRVWLTRTDPIRPVYVTWSGLFGLISVFAVLFTLMDPANSHMGGLWTTIMLALLPLVPLSLFRLAQTRHVLAAGYSLPDLRQALAQHVARSREEMAYEGGRKPSVGGRLLRAVSYASLAGAGVATWIVTHAPLWGITAGGALKGFGIFSLVTVLTALLGMTYPGRRVRQRPVGEWRLRFWNSRLAPPLVRLVRVGLRQRTGTESMVQRPTEIAIGLAAADLFAALPKATRRELSQLPGIVKQLEDDAQSMRRRVQELDARLAEAAANTGDRSAVLQQYGGDDSLARQRHDVASDLRSARDAAGRRLATAVAALENIRLDLLRLQAGTGEVHSITAALEAARRMGSDIDVAIADRAPGEAVLPTPPE